MKFCLWIIRYEWLLYLMAIFVGLLLGKLEVAYLW